MSEYRVSQITKIKLQLYNWLTILSSYHDLLPKIDLKAPSEMSRPQRCFLNRVLNISVQYSWYKIKWLAVRKIESVLTVTSAPWLSTVQQYKPLFITTCYIKQSFGNPGIILGINNMIASHQENKYYYIFYFVRLL